MDELIIIFSFIIIATLIVFGTVNSMHKRTLKHRQQREALDRQSTNTNSDGSAEKVDRLEQRVRVLERLATDRGQDLALQIEELRDPARTAFASTREDSSL